MKHTTNEMAEILGIPRPRVCRAIKRLHDRKMLPYKPVGVYNTTAYKKAKQRRMDESNTKKM